MSQPPRLGLAHSSGCLAAAVGAGRPPTTRGDRHEDALSLRVLAKRGVSTWEQILAKLADDLGACWHDHHERAAAAWLVSEFGSEADRRLLVRACLRRAGTQGAACCAARVDPLWLGLAALAAALCDERRVAALALVTAAGQDFASSTLAPSLADHATQVVLNASLGVDAHSMAADLLASLDPPEAGGVLARLLEDPEAELRLVACDLISQLRYVAATPMLEHLAAHDLTPVPPYTTGACPGPPYLTVSQAAGQALANWALQANEVRRS